MNLIVIATIASVWVFFALLLAGCAHGLGTARRAPHGAATAWMGEEHAPIVRVRGAAGIPASHPLARLTLRAPRHAGRSV